MIVVLMGVTGAGKTTIGNLLAQGLGWELVDADSFHWPANVEKIKLGIPLDDADRAPWLKSLHKAIQQWFTEHRNVVLALGIEKDLSRSAFLWRRGKAGLLEGKLRPDRPAPTVAPRPFCHDFATR